MAFKYSVIVPVYNVEEHLPTALDSLFKQSYHDYEIVIVNDGSTDDCDAICRRYISKYPDRPVKYVTQENCGLLAARRRGIVESSGEYLIHMDSDDAIRLDALEVINHAIEATGADLLFFRGSFSPNYKKCKLGELPWQIKGVELLDKKRVIGAFIDGYVSSLCLKVANRKCVDTDNLYTEYGRLTIGEDQLQSLVILDKAERLAYLDEPLYYYRQRETSSTSKYRPGKQVQYAKVKEAVYEQAKKWDSVYAGGQFAHRALKNYLANSYYDLRKSVRYDTATQEFDELRASGLFDRAYRYKDELRPDMRVLMSLVHAGHDWAAATLFTVMRVVEEAARKLHG